MATSIPQQTDDDPSRRGSVHHAVLAEIIMQSDAWTDVVDVKASIHDAVSAVSELPDVLGPRSQEVSIVLADDDTVRDLNKSYRKLDKPTNVLSFPYPPPDLNLDDGDNPYLGDVVLAYETIAAEAETMERGLNAHVSHLVIHGLLHLLGFDHETDTEARQMEQLEVSLLAKLGIANPYQETFQDEASE